MEVNNSAGAQWCFSQVWGVYHTVFPTGSRRRFTVPLQRIHQGHVNFY